MAVKTMVLSLVWMFDMRFPVSLFAWWKGRRYRLSDF